MEIWKLSFWLIDQTIIPLPKKKYLIVDSLNQMLIRRVRALYMSVSPPFPFSLFVQHALINQSPQFLQVIFSYLKICFQASSLDARFLSNGGRTPLWTSLSWSEKRDYGQQLSFFEDSMLDYFSIAILKSLNKGLVTIDLLEVSEIPWL